MLPCFGISFWSCAGSTGPAPGGSAGCAIVTPVEQINASAPNAKDFNLIPTLLVGCLETIQQEMAWERYCIRRETRVSCFTRELFYTQWRVSCSLYLRSSSTNLGVDVFGLRQLCARNYHIDVRAASSVGPRRRRFMAANAARGRSPGGCWRCSRRW